MEPCSNTLATIYHLYFLTVKPLFPPFCKMMIYYCISYNHLSLHQFCTMSTYLTCGIAGQSSHGRYSKNILPPMVLFTGLLQR